MKTYFILDGYSLIYKSYFAFIRNPMMNPKGENSSAVFGFFRTLFSLFDRYNPEYFLVTLDSLTPTFRHEMYPEYKATRDKTPEDLHAQIPRIEAILKALGITALRKNGFEADDIIATYAKKCQDEDSQCRIITGDKDLLQLVSDNVKVIRYSKDDYNEMDRDGVFKEWGVWPEQILDYLALCGDSADNIPGVKGIGPKGAVTLLQTYGNIDSIYENIENIKGANKTKLEAGKEDCLLSRKLVELRNDVPLEQCLDDFSTASLDYHAAVPLLKEEGIKSAIKWLEEKAGVPEGGLFTQSLSEEADEAPKPEAKKGVYTAITQLSQLDELIEKVKKAGIYAFDSETDSLDFVSNHPVGFSIAIRPEEGFYIPIQAEGKYYIPEEIIKNKLRQILEDPSLKLVGQNFKFDYQVLKRWGINPAGLWFDTMIAAWLVDTKISVYNMDYLADHYFGYKTITYDEVVPKGKFFQDVPLEQATEYAAEDADITFRLYEHLYPIVKANNEKLFFDVEMPLVTILGDMELEGIRIDKHVLEKYSVELDAQLGAIEKEIYKECGKEFNINSTQQLQEILFTDRKLKPIKKTKTGYSTDTSVLEELALEDVVPQMILRYRALAKLKSTYVDALPLQTDSSSRIHTTFRQTGTATGRLSSINPNLQNIPIRDEEG
ncbi:MAG: DNA polymerase I, partial [Spirochaetia bacterium]|nr:DNA polymerase I [Spirochaetia bacterium]